MKYLVGLFFLTIIAYSCGTQKDQVKAAKAEVMEIHDQVMPEMGNLRKLQKALVEKSLSKDSAESIKLVELAGNVTSANESMMNWMHDFNPNFQGTEEERLLYFEEQKKSIAQVQKTMLDVLSAAQQALR